MAKIASRFRLRTSINTSSSTIVTSGAVPSWLIVSCGDDSDVYAGDFVPGVNCNFFDGGVGERERRDDDFGEDVRSRERGDS